MFSFVYFFINTFTHRNFLGNSTIENVRPIFDCLRGVVFWYETANELQK
jgi:hypothetical protein